MAGAILFSSDAIWSASYQLFYWVMETIADLVEDAELAAILREISDESLGLLAFDDLTENQKAEVRRCIVESLEPAAEHGFNRTAPTYESLLRLIDELVYMASASK